MVDDEQMILRLATEALKDYAGKYNVLTAVDGSQAVDILSNSPVDLVLTDLKMPVMDGYELLSYMSKNYKNIPSIVMTGFGSPEIAKRLKQKGVLHYIEKPFDLNVLREKIASVFSASSRGFVSGFSLPNFLQAVEVDQKTITLRIRSKERLGYLHLVNGELIDAETDELSGEEAALEILCWSDPEIEIQEIQKNDRTIETSLMQILLESSKIIDEKGESSKPKDADLKIAIRYAEGHYFKKSHELLSRFLKKNPRSFKAWLWYSRIVTNVKSIEASLNNAARLAPVDTDVIEETRKFTSVIDKIKTKQVRRCPFCWAPMENSSNDCLYCKSHLIIDDNFFTSARNGDPEILNKAIERYTRVIGREQNISAHYYLSLAHLNMEHWEEGLNLFHKTVKLAPKKTFFSNQLRTLLNHMASKESAFEAKIADTAKHVYIPPEDKDKKKKILVVEDSATTRKVISITLVQKGYEIIEAKDGLEALSRLNEEKPDLILLDIILPKMDGYKILSIIKNNNLFKNIPVIMLTGKDGFLNKMKGRLAGSTAYLTKPFNPKELVDTIAKHI